jgi:hypothetical protein
MHGAQPPNPKPKNENGASTEALTPSKGERM